MNGDPGSTWPLTRQIILVVILVATNGLFAAAEMAFVSLSQTKINELSSVGNKKAMRVMKLLEQSDDLLHTLHVMIILVGFLNSAFAAYHFAPVLAAAVGNFKGATELIIVLLTIGVAYVTLVLGETYPKEYALQQPEKIAMNVSGLIVGIQALLKPFIWLISSSTRVLKKITPVDFDAAKETMTRDEFRSYLDQSRQNEVIDIAEFSMLKGVLSLDNKIAREVMVPRTDTFMLDYDDGNEINIDKLLEVQYSRVPIYFEDKDNILGIVHVKNLLKASKEKTLKTIDLKDIMNEPLFVPETIYIDDSQNLWLGSNNSLSYVTINTNREISEVMLLKSDVNVKTIEKHGKDIWVGGNNLILRYSFTSSEKYVNAPIPSTIDISDQTINCFFSFGDYLWTGTTNGLYGINTLSNYYTH